MIDGNGDGTDLKEMLRRWGLICQFFRNHVQDFHHRIGEIEHILAYILQIFSIYLATQLCRGDCFEVLEEAHQAHADKVAGHVFNVWLFPRLIFVGAEV